MAARGLVDQAARDLSAAGEKIQALEKLEIKGHLDVNQGAPSGDTVSGRLDKRKELIGALSVHLNNAEKAVTTLDGLKILPEKLISQRDRVLAEAQQNDARGQAEKFYNDAMTALERGDVAAAQNGYAMLKQLYDQLVQEYQLRIVSREGYRAVSGGFPKTMPMRVTTMLLSRPSLPMENALNFPSPVKRTAKPTPSNNGACGCKNLFSSKSSVTRWTTASSTTTCSASKNAALCNPGT